MSLQGTKTKYGMTNTTSENGKSCNVYMKTWPACKCTTFNVYGFGSTAHSHLGADCPK